MKYLSLIPVLCFLMTSCSRTPENVKIDLTGKSQVILNGQGVGSLSSLRNELRELRKKYGVLEVLVRADGEIKMERFHGIADLISSEGFGNILTGRVGGDDLLLYPTFHTWTNEWKWDSYFDRENEHIRIKPDHGINIRLLSDGVLIESETHSLDDAFSHLKNLSGGDRARAVLSADPEAEYGDLLRLLEVCKEYSIDTLYVQDWIQYVYE